MHYFRHNPLDEGCHEGSDENDEGYGRTAANAQVDKALVSVRYGNDNLLHRCMQTAVLRVTSALSGLCTKFSARLRCTVKELH